MFISGSFEYNSSYIILYSLGFLHICICDAKKQGVASTVDTNEAR